MVGRVAQASQEPRPATGEATEITLLGATTAPGDGLELRGSTLFVVTREGASHYVGEWKLGPGLTAALRVGARTSEGFAVPTTAAFAAGNLYVVNARFGTPVTPDTEYRLTTVDL